MAPDEAGVDLDSAFEGGQRVLRKHLGRAAKELSTKAFVAPGAEGTRAATGKTATGRGLFEEPCAPPRSRRCSVIFGQEMERVLRDVVESGKVSKLPTLRKKSRRRRK